MSDTARVTAPAEVTPAPHRVAIFAVVAMALLMSSLDGTIVATALHAIEHGLGSTINWAGWVITAYSVGQVLAYPLAGKLSDRVGRRRFFFISVVVFTVASLCAGLADSIYLLIALRAVQAVGGAGFTPSATGIITENFGSARDKAVGLFGSIFPIGSMIGPIFGGLFVSYWSWRGIFFVNMPIGALLLLLGLRYVPRDRERPGGAHRPTDLFGMVLLGVGALAPRRALALRVARPGRVPDRPRQRVLLVGEPQRVPAARTSRRTAEPPTVRLLPSAGPDGRRARRFRYRTG